MSTAPQPCWRSSSTRPRCPTCPSRGRRVEIWVCSPRVEGVHLRFGPVARGGLRWSDRREDFRTEVLGLVKAQMVKNAVIVPTGAKGGFVVKRPPADRARPRRPCWPRAVACYRMFIGGLLDSPTTCVDGAGRAAAERVVRHDGDDTYLVVAADKGTATFSDIANAVAARATASGSATRSPPAARSATTTRRWASPPAARGSRSSGTSASSASTSRREDFTVVGIGDMSGDVFGNGMLLSEHIRLVAAFDHRHVFLDPDPGRRRRPSPSGERLFDLPRSSWADYDRVADLAPAAASTRARRSRSRSSPQVRAALGLADDVDGADARPS